MGTHALTAVYSGSTGYAGSTSTTVNEVVNPLTTTTTTLEASPVPATFGQSVTLSVTVASGSGTPTGSVQFLDGSTILGRPPLSGGTATLSTSSLSLGSHSLTAVYTASGNFAGSTSTARIETINQDSTTTTLGSSANPAVLGQAVTFTATVAAASPGSGIPTGSVTFKDGSTVIGTGTLNASGQATLTTSSLTVANHTITAVYGGDTNFTTSSNLLSQVVGHANTSVSLAASVNPAKAGTYVLLTATVVVTAPGGGTPAGTVTFTDGSTKLGIISVVAANGVITAKLQLNNLTIGTHNLVATYSGSSGYAGSVSTTLVEIIN